MRNVFFCLLIGILFWGCSDENPSISFAEISSSSAIETFSSSIENVESSSSVVESSSSEIIISSSSGISYGELLDERDGQVYKTIKIGNQTWMAENLNYAYLQPIEGFPDSSSFCYNNEPDSCAKYGRLYPWGAAIDSIGLYNEYGGYDQCGDPDEFNNVSLSGVCPPNWHIPSVDEWRSFIDIISKNSLELKIYDINHQIGKKTCFWTPLQYSNIPENLYCGGYFYAYRFCFSSSDREVSFDNDRKTKTFPVRCAKGPPTYVE